MDLPVFAQTQVPLSPSLLPTQDLYSYAVDTWRSFEAMAFPGGLPADFIRADGERAQFTSPSNIAAYLWSTLAAGELQIIPPDETCRRIRETLHTLAWLERHTPSGMFYNWYDPYSGDTLTAWPASGQRIAPYLSSVDNGWLAAALMLVGNALPSVREAAQALLDRMDFGFFLNPGSGLLYGGYWPALHRSAEPHPIGYTRYDFGSLNTEPRIASYIGIAQGSLPPEHYFRMWRTFPPTGAGGWQKVQPRGVTRTYLGVEVFEGHYPYAGMGIVPTWEGSLFEALMPALFVPEAQWGPASWGINHPLYVQAQIHHGLVASRLGYWGFSPAANPCGGYAVYGVEAIGMNADTHPVKHSAVVTPHAAFLALPYAPQQAMQNLEKLRQNFAIYGPWGFWDSVDVRTGQVAPCVLSLDQGMVLASLANVLLDNRLQALFSRGKIEQAIRPLLEMEEFSAGVLAPE